MAYTDELKKKVTELSGRYTEAKGNTGGFSGQLAKPGYEDKVTKLPGTPGEAKVVKLPLASGERRINSDGTVNPISGSGLVQYAGNGQSGAAADARTEALRQQWDAAKNGGTAAQGSSTTKKIWDDGTDYHEDAINAAKRGDWAAVQDSLKKREQKIASIGTDAGKSSMDILNELYAQYGTSGTGAYMPHTYGSVESLDSRVEQLSRAQQEAALQALQSAYDKNVIDLNAAAAKIPQTYQAARNQVAGNAAVTAANFNEYAAAAGLNSGAAGQAQLSMANQNQGDLASISLAESNAVNDLETQRLKLSTQYQNDIAQAIANGELEKASMLYQEAVRVQNTLIALEQAQADENYRAWTANFQRNESNKSFQKSMASNMLANGVMPSADMLAAAGIPEEYAKAMLQQKQTGYSGGGLPYSPGTPEPTENKYLLNTDQTDAEYDAYMSAVSKFRKTNSINGMSDAEYDQFMRYYDGGVYGQYYDAAFNGTATDAQVRILKNVGIDVKE